MRSPGLLALAASVGLLACDDTAVVLVVSSDRKIPAELDAFCIEVDSGGASRFHRHVDVTTLPQTLTVLPGGDDTFGASILGLREGVYVDDLRLRIGFRSHDVSSVDLPLRRCPPIATSGRYHQVDVPALGGAMPVLVDSAAGPRVLALGAGMVAELAWNGSTLAPLAGAKLPPALAGAPSAVAAADLDGDCTIDLVIGETGGPPHVWKHDGAGGFTEVAGALPADLVGPAAIVIADFDGDRKVDVVAVGPAGRMFRGDGTGHFAEVANAFEPPPGNPKSAAAGDFRGAGGPDLIVGQTGGAPTLVYLNDSGVLHSSPGAIPNVTLDIVGVAAIDVDGDGDRDVVLAHPGGVRLLLNRGNGYLEDGSFGRVPGAITAAALAAADLDRDCQMDLVIPVAGGPPVLWAGQGGGAFKVGTVDAVAGTPTRVVIGDVDGNGSRDVVLAGATGGAVWIQQ